MYDVPVVVTGSHLATGSGDSCHGIRFSADITLTDGATFSATGTALASGAGSDGIFFENGAWVMDDALNTATFTGSSACAGSGCTGITFALSFPLAACNDGGTACSFSANGASTSPSAGGHGIVILGAHAFTQTDLTLVGTSLSGDGIVATGAITTDQQGDISLSGSTTGDGRAGVVMHDNVGFLPLNSGNLEITGSAPISGVFMDIVYPNGIDTSSKTGGTITYNSPLTVNLGGQVLGPIDLTIVDGIQVTGGTLNINPSRDIRWDGVSIIESDTDIGPAGPMVTLGTSSIDIDGGQLSFSRDVLLSTDVTILNDVDVCIFFAPVDGAHKLTLASDGVFKFGDNVGLVTPLNLLDVPSSGSTLRFESSFASAASSVLRFSGAVEFDLGSTGAAGFDCETFQSTLSLTDVLGSTTDVSVACNGVEVAGSVSINSLTVRGGIGSTPRTTLLNGDFSSSGLVSLRDDHFATAIGTYPTISARDTVTLTGGSPSGGNNGCFSANGLALVDTSTFQVDIEGADGSPCSLYDQVSVSGAVAVSPTATLSVVTNGTVIRGDTYFVLKDFVGISAQFGNAPEGTALMVGPLIMFVTYLEDEPAVAGNDVALVANQLPDVMDDEYTIVGVTTLVESPPGVLLNDTDPEGSSLTASLVLSMPPAEGSIVLQSDGSFVYNSGGFIGVTTFVYEAFDGFESAPATVTINVLLASPTPTSTPTGTPTASQSMSGTSTRSPTMTSTGTASSTTTSTSSTSQTETSTATPSSTQTPTSSVTSTSSETATPSSSQTASKSPSRSPSMTASSTASNTATSSPSNTAIPTSTPTATETATKSVTMTPSNTASATASPSSTKSASSSPTNTPTAGSTPSETPTPTKSSTSTSTPTMSQTQSETSTSSGTRSPSRTGTPAETSTPTMTSTGSATASATASATSPGRRSATPSASPVLGVSATSTRTTSPTPTPSESIGASGSATQTGTMSTTATAAASGSSLPSLSSSMSASPSPTATQSPSRSSSDTSSATVTPSATKTPSASPTGSNTSSVTPTDSPSPTSSSTSTSSATESTSSTRSTSASPTHLTEVPSNSKTPTPTTTRAEGEIILPPNPAPSSSPTRTRSVTASRTGSQTRLPGVSVSSTPPPIAGFGQPQGEDEFIPTEVTVFDGSETDRFVPFMAADGSQVGSVTVPEETAGALIIASDFDADPIDEIVSVVVDVTIVGPNGQLVTEFDDAIEICFETDEDEEDVCLGFFNEDGRWECEDFCLESTDRGICGETDHLTSFALLLDSTAGSSDKCGSDSTNYVIVYISIAMISVAIIAVIVFAVLIEIRLRVKAYMLENTFRDIERGTETTGLGSD